MSLSEERKKREDARSKALLKEQVRRKQVIDGVLRTDAGKQLFRLLHTLCGFSKPSIVTDPKTGEIFGNSTEYNEGRRALYLQLREMANPELLIPVEFPTLGLEKEQEKPTKKRGK